MYQNGLQKGRGTASKTAPVSPSWTSPCSHTPAGYPRTFKPPAFAGAFRNKLNFKLPKASSSFRA